MKVEIIAHVRKAGAIGVFYDEPFVVETEYLAPKEVKRAWFEQFGDDWEWHHLIGITPPTGEVTHEG